MIEGAVYTFGVSGLLYKSNVLMYDHQTESLWLQVRREAVTGPMTGTRLKVLPSTIMTWDRWRKRYPSTRVLSQKTGYDRDYSRDPYQSYYGSRDTLFGRIFLSGPGEEQKQLVAGIEINGFYKAYPLDLIRDLGRVEDTLAGRRLTLDYDRTTDVLTVTTEEGEIIHPIVAYRFVWMGINPDSETFRVP